MEPLRAGWPLLLLTVSAAAAPAAAQEPHLPSESEVREVLETSAIQAVLASLGPQVVAALEGAAPSLDEDARGRIGEAVNEAFAPDRLYGHVVAYLRSRAGGGELAALRGWLLSDAFREIQAKSAPGSLEESFEEYMARLRGSPPAEERVDLAARYVQAQRAGEFYVALGDRVRSAALRLAAAPEGAGAVAPPQPSARERAQELQQYRMFSILSFLQQLEPLSDDEARRLVEAYESPSGQWYVGAYTEALLSAIDAAADAAVARVRS